MTRAHPTRRPTQAERTAAMKQRLIDAAISSLIENGYAHTTSVEVCRRAGVTRGALNHHFADLPALLIEVLERIYADVAPAEQRDRPEPVEAMIRGAWKRLQRPEWKAVIEIWLAARNDPALGTELAPAIARLSALFDPLQSRALAARLGSDPAQRTFYRLAAETMLGLALGRAVSPAGKAVAHENEVMALLTSLARRHAGR